MSRTLSILIRIGLAGPLAWWIWLTLNNGLGAEPIVKLNKNFGNLVLILIVANLWIGVLLRYKWGPRAILQFLTKERRFLGITSGFYLALHLLTYFAKESFERKAVEMIFTKFYLTMGFAAALCIWVLTFTSNNFSVKKLGGKKWKTLHRSLHFFSLAILIHIFLIEKADLIYMAAVTFPLAAVQLYRGFSKLIPAVLGKIKRA